MSNKTILVLEDEKILQTSIKIKLEKEGYNVISCINYSDAINELEKNTKIDLFWIDHYLEGDKTGLDFVGVIKRSNDYKKVPVFVITNFEDYQNAVLFMEKIASGSSADSYLNYKIEKFFVKSNTTLEQIIAEVKKFLK